MSKILVQIREKSRKMKFDCIFFLICSQFYIKNNQQILPIMKSLKQILFPTDFSEPAKGAFLYALKVAKEIGANIIVLHSYRGDFGVPVPEVMAYQMLEARKEEAEHKMAAFAKLASDCGFNDVSIRTVVEMGLAMDVIVDYTATQEENIDLIIMGTKGEHNVTEVIFGSVTTGVIANATCPVLAIPEGANYKDIKTIVYATDFKSDTLDSVKEAATIAALFDAELHCVRVDTKKKDGSSEMTAFNELIAQLPQSPIRLAEISSDTIAHGLDVYVHEQGIQLILMSRPQRGLFESIFHRSVTKQVALHSTIPLLVFRKG